MKIQSFSSPVLSYLRTEYKKNAGSGAQLSETAAAQSPPDGQQEPGAGAPASAAPSSLRDQDATDEKGFFEYMASPSSNALSPPKSHDLTRPISNYFISTSHNTYLSGNQLYGDASTRAYTNVLVRGCRCLEIDVWDGESDSDDHSSSDEIEGKRATSGSQDTKTSKWGRLKAKAKDAKGQAATAAVDYKHRHDKKSSDLPSSGNGSQPSPDDRPKYRVEPRVLHGHTLTKDVSFRAVCNAIRDSAFAVTELPLIVSLEIHAGLEQQEIMVEIMKDAWKNLLVDIDEKQEFDIQHLPSPDQLRRKILIKVKWSSDVSSTAAQKAPKETNNPVDIVEAGKLESSDEEQGDASPSLTTVPAQEKRKKASKILKSLSELGVYTRAYSFKKFDQPESKIPTHVFSLSEKKVQDMHETHRSQLFNHNRNYLMRVFPSGLRVNSSNVEPTFLWSQGAQMVALNWQKWDRGMMLNEGMFAGEQGWVLKPNGYHNTIGPKSTASDVTIARKTLSLTIELLAGQNIPLPKDKEDSHFARFQKFHPYVKAQLHIDYNTTTSGNASEASADGADARNQNEKERDEDISRFKKQSRTAKSTEPDFLGETMRWLNIPDVVEELSFIRYVFLDLYDLYFLSQLLCTLLHIFTIAWKLSEPHSRTRGEKESEWCVPIL